MKAMEARAIANQIIGNMEVMIIDGHDWASYEECDAKLIQKYIELICKEMRMKADYYFLKRKK